MSITTYRIEFVNTDLHLSFPILQIHSIKKPPSKSDGNALHIKALWNTSFPDTFSA